MRIEIDNNACVRCGRCATVCPSAVFEAAKADETTRQNNTGNPADRITGIAIRNSNACIKCGHCLNVCATGAILHEAIPPTMVHRIDRSVLPSPDSLMELLRSRRSNRTFTEEAIPHTALQRLKEAALYAPTAENTRNVEVQFLTDPEQLLRLEKAVMGFFMRIVSVMNSLPVRLVLRPFLSDLYARIPELLAMQRQLEAGKRPSTVNATAIMLITAPKKSMFGYQDCNLAYQNASLMAESMGISQVYLGFVQTAFGMWGNSRTAKLLGLPRDRKPFAIMALGIPAFKYLNYTERNQAPQS